jgi:uncharacterized membrane protein
MARSLVLFAHIVGVLTLFTGLILEWVGWSIVQGSTARAETLAFMRVTVALQRVYGVAFVTILASGFYLGGRSGVLGDGWMRATYLGLVLIALSGAVARPRVRRIREALADPSDRAFSALRSSAHDTALRVSLHARVALVLALVYLMISKPVVLGTAIAVIGLALVSALATSLTRSRVAPAAFRSSLP